MTCGRLEFQNLLKVSCNSGLKFSHCNWSWETFRHLRQALPPCFRASSLHASLPAWPHQTAESDSWSNTSSLCKLKKKKNWKAANPSESLVQFSSVTQSCPTLCNPMNHSTPGLPVHHQFLESTQTHVHWVGDAIQPSHPLSSPSPPALNLSQHQGLFKWVSSSHQVATGLEFQLQHQSFQWTPRTDLL